MKKLIYAVEDDAAIRELYDYALENDFECVCFESSAAFFSALERNGLHSNPNQCCRPPGLEKRSPDLILLDVMLPGEDGFEILARLKAGKKSAKIPVIMVSAKGDELSKVKGLNLGADDYIAKPFGVLELVARVKANLRKTAPPVGVISYKDIEIDPSRHVISANSREIQATLKEFNLLRFLCENAEKLQSRDVLFREIWGEDFIGETRTLDIHIKELRKKLASADCEAKIQTVRGVGYMLT